MKRNNGKEIKWDEDLLKFSSKFSSIINLFSNPHENRREEGEKQRVEDRKLTKTKNKKIQEELLFYLVPERKDGVGARDGMEPCFSQRARYSLVRRNLRNESLSIRT